MRERADDLLMGLRHSEYSAERTSLAPRMGKRNVAFMSSGLRQKLRLFSRWWEIFRSGSGSKRVAVPFQEAFVTVVTFLQRRCGVHGSQFSMEAG